MLSNIMQLLVVVIVFFLVLAVTYYATKWVAKSGVIQSQSANIKVIETFKIAPNKYIQIIKLGSKYYSIGVTKENITFLTPLEEEQLEFAEKEENQQQAIPFRDMLGKIIKKEKEK